MIPVLAIVRVRQPKGGFAIWAPVVLLWPLAAIVALILSPFFAVYWTARRVNPFAVAGAMSRLVFNLRGLNVEVESPSASVQVRLI